MAYLQHMTGNERLSTFALDHQFYDAIIRLTYDLLLCCRIKPEKSSNYPFKLEDF